MFDGMNVAHEGTAGRVKRRHHQCRTDTFARNVADRHKKPLVFHRKVSDVISANSLADLVGYRNLDPATIAWNVRIEVLLNLASKNQFLLDLALLDDLEVQLGIFERQSHVHRHARQELLVFQCETACTVQQFEHADNVPHTIHDRHAVNVSGVITKDGVKTAIEARVRICVRNVDRFSGCTNRSRDAPPQRKNNFLSFHILRDKGSQYPALTIQNEHRSAGGADFISNDSQDDGRELRQIQRGVEQLCRFQNAMQALDATDGVEMCLWLPRHSPFDGGNYATTGKKSHIRISENRA